MVGVVSWVAKERRSISEGRGGVYSVSDNRGYEYLEISTNFSLA